MRSVRPGGNCSCGRRATPTSTFCLPCRVSLRRWIAMSEHERGLSYGRAEQRWNRVCQFSTRKRRKAA